MLKSLARSAAVLTALISLAAQAARCPPGFAPDPANTNQCVINCVDGQKPDPTNPRACIAGCGPEQKPDPTNPSACIADCEDGMVPDPTNPRACIADCETGMTNDPTNPRACIQYCIFDPEPYQTVPTCPNNCPSGASNTAKGCVADCGPGMTNDPKDPLKCVVDCSESGMRVDPNNPQLCIANCVAPQVVDPSNTSSCYTPSDTGSAGGDEGNGGDDGCGDENDCSGEENAQFSSRKLGVASASTGVSVSGQTVVSGGTSAGLSGAATPVVASNMQAYSNTPTSPVTNQNGVMGVVDQVNSQYGITGWACNRQNPYPINVEVFAGDPSQGQSLGVFVANLPGASSQDTAAIDAACQSVGLSYRFNIPLRTLNSAPAGAPIYVVGLSAMANSSNQVLANSGGFALPAIAAPVTAHDMNGVIDQVSARDGISGWACNLNDAPSINVQVYAGDPAQGGQLLGVFPANVPSEPAVAAACQSSGTAYRFNIPLFTLSVVPVGAPVFVVGVSQDSGFASNAIINSGGFSFPFLSSPTGDAHNPMGIIDQVSAGGGISGWACNRGDINSLNGVEVFAGDPSRGGQLLGVFPANLASEPAVAAVCASSGSNYRFSIPLSALNQVPATLPVYVVGLSRADGFASLPITNSGNFFFPSDCWQGNWFGVTNVVGLTNGDPRFLCEAGRWYDCGWEGNDASWETKVPTGGSVSGWTCSGASWTH